MPGLRDELSGATECCYSPLPPNAEWLASCSWQCQAGYFQQGLQCVHCDGWRGVAPAHSNWSQSDTGCSRIWLCDAGYKQRSGFCVLPQRTCQTCLAAVYSWCNSRCQEDSNEECFQDCSQADSTEVTIVLCIMGSAVALAIGVLVGWCCRARMKKAWRHKSLNYLFTPDLAKVAPEVEFDEARDDEESDPDDASGLGTDPPDYATLARQGAFEFNAIPRRASVVGPDRPRGRRVHPAARPQRARAANQRSSLAGDRPAAQNPLAGRSGPRQPLPLALTHGRWFDRQAAAAEDPALNSLPPTSPLSTDSSRNNQSRVVRAARRARNRGPPSIEPAAALRSGNPYNRANATGATAYEQQAQGWLQAADHQSYPSRSVMGTPRLPTSPSAFMASLPEVRMTSQMLSEGGKSDNNSCCICLEDYAPNDRVRVLPCLHRFHSSCIGSWTCKRNTCPLCNDTIFRGL